MVFNLVVQRCKSYTLVMNTFKMMMNSWRWWWTWYNWYFDLKLNTEKMTSMVLVIWFQWSNKNSKSVFLMNQKQNWYDEGLANGDFHIQSWLVLHSRWLGLMIDSLEFYVSLTSHLVSESGTKTHMLIKWSCKFSHFRIIFKIGM